MENASKALVIAGAIILVIVLITLGYNVIKNNTDIINKGNTNQAEIEAFNAEFEPFIGNNKRAADVKNLYSKIIAKNAAEESNNSDRRVKMYIDNDAIIDDKITDYSKVSVLKNSDTFKIEVKTYEKGCISEIKITKE